jgi:hypothetical protein
MEIKLQMNADVRRFVSGIMKKLDVLFFRDPQGYHWFTFVQGCGHRYGNSAQYLMILHFPSLRAGAAPHGGILTLADTTLLVCVFPAFSSGVLFVILSLLCFEAHVTNPVFENGASRRWRMRLLKFIYCSVY